jgi:GST-like protein
VLEKRLAESAYLAGAEYSIADMATYPWLRNPAGRNIDLAEYPNVRRWYEAIEARPAVQRGCAVLADQRRQGQMTDAEREVLFGKTQFAKR